jgi:hypothetical protein
LNPLHKILSGFEYALQQLRRSLIAGTQNRHIKTTLDTGC